MHPLGVLRGVSGARVSLQETEHESDRLEISPIRWAGVTDIPDSCPGNVWRRTGLQRSAGGRGVEDLRSAQVCRLQNPVMLCGGGCKLSRILFFFFAHRSIVTASLRASSSNRQIPA